MIVAGFTLFAGALVDANRSLLFTIGLAVSAAPIAVLVHLILAFPEGRLHSAFERVLVGAAYFNAVVVQIVMLMFMGIEHVSGCPCPRNLLFRRDDMTLHARLMDTERIVGVVIAVAVASVLARRYWRASPVLRRALSPILLTGGLTCALLGAVLVANQAAASFANNLQAAERLALATVPIAYLVGLFRSHLARGSVSDLVLELGRTPDEQGRLRDALARTLRDPSLELGYWVSDSGQYVDLDGNEVSATATSTRAVTVLERHGRKVAVLVHDAALRENPTLLEAASSAAGLALENERLLAELRAQLEQIRESRARIVDAGDAERRRLERNLHDGAQQRLVAVSLQITRAATKLKHDPTEAAALLDHTKHELGLALEELRELARGIHPAVLTERGLSVALSGLVDRAPIPVTVTEDLPQRLPRPT
jgi:signal transduction histidine kinase